MTVYEFKVVISAYVEVEATSQEEAENMIYDDPSDFMADGDWTDIDVRFRRAVEV